jgi:hypothetical protein
VPFRSLGVALLFNMQYVLIVIIFLLSYFSFIQDTNCIGNFLKGLLGNVYISVVIENNK